MSHSGHCLCGSVSYELDGEPGWTGYCHCDSCRRNCAAPVAAFMEIDTTLVRWTGTMPATYESTPGARRKFCAGCGTPVAFEADWYPGVVHLYIALLEDPASVTPAEHVHHEERLPWFNLADDLKRTDGFGGLTGDPRQPTG